MLTIIHTLVPAIRTPKFLLRATPFSPSLFSKRFPCLQIQKPTLCFCFKNSAMSTLRIVTEYAKSNKSTCKQCSEKITKDAPRLGVVIKGSRGYDETKWHHFKCLPAAAAKVGDPEAIKGFDLLKSDDQEALKKLMSGCGKSSDEKVDADEENEAKETTSKKRKVTKAVEDLESEEREKNLKKKKLEAPDDKVVQQISFSASDVKSKYKDATLLPNWKAFQTIIFLERDDGLVDSNKIAAFDFDGCLANTSVKRIGESAWSLMYTSIPAKLKSLYDDGYKLVIFTNESNIERWKKKRQVAVDSKLGRLNNFIKRVKLPIQVFVACGLGKPGAGKAEDPFRKPQPGMWRIMEQHFNSGISIDMYQSFYVGDAAGRKGDHSDADIKFAEAVGLKFYVPEEYFDEPK